MVPRMLRHQLPARGKRKFSDSNIIAAQQELANSRFLHPLQGVQQRELQGHSLRISRPLLH